MRLLLLSAPLVFTAGLCGQTVQSSPAVAIALPLGDRCPVGFEARHTQVGNLVSTDRSARHPETGYNLTFSPEKTKTIAQARITLHGLAGGQVIPAGPSGPYSEAPATRDASEAFTVAPGADTHHLFRSTVYVKKLTGVQWLELNEITYADGSQWHASADATCRITPDGFMLVASGR